MVRLDDDTAQRLLDLNRRFYSDFGGAFAATRRRVQPGVLRSLERLPRRGHWLDLGCGTGELARALARGGFCGRYLGLDASLPLLADARHQPPSAADFSVEFRQADLAAPAWDAALESGAWQVISCFAVLHHLPGAALRERVLRRARLLLGEGGRFVHSVWQFQHSPKLMARIQPWQRAGLDAPALEEGDTLLDWRYALPGQPEQVGLRYVHLFTRAELATLAAACGFAIVDEFESDGEGGRLGLYQVWKGVEG